VELGDIIYKSRYGIDSLGMLVESQDLVE